MQIGDKFIVRDLIDGVEFLAIVSAKDYEEENQQLYATILSLGVTIQVDNKGELIGFKGDALDRYYSSHVFKSNMEKAKEREKYNQEKQEKARIEKFIARYKSIANEPDDFVLTKDNVEEWVFRRTCNLLGWSFDKARTEILGIPWHALDEDSGDNA